MSTTNKEIIQKVNDAFNRNDMQTFLAYCTEDIQWNMIGNSSTKGKDAILKMMTEMPGDSPDIIIEEILTEENKAACTGTFTMTKSSGESSRYSFCDVYQFADGKIQVLDSYVVEIKQ